MKHSFSLVLSSLILISKMRAQPYLFQKFPQLQDKIPHITLCDLPTPIQKLTHFGQAIGCSNIFIKRDDLTGAVQKDGVRLYGGNKPRKLEFLLADALQKQARAVVTCGSAGSNHGLATTVYAQQVGLPTILLLKPQPNSPIVRHNLLLDYYHGAQLQSFPDKRSRNVALHTLGTDGALYAIPAGGSTVLGVIGFVNAAYELAGQIAQGAMPTPDYIYVATGSCATAAGLLLGLQAAQIRARVVAVCVEPEETPDEFLLTIKQLFAETNAFLHERDASFPRFDFPHDALTINKDFCGPEYGFLIPEAAAAINLFQEAEQISLEGTYSAKPIAAIIADADTMRDTIVLFWNTYCGLDFSSQIASVDYKNLPQEFHRYFEEEV